MIVNAVLALVHTLVSWLVAIVNLLWGYVIDTSIVSSVWSVFSRVNEWIPVSDAFVIVGIVGLVAGWSSAVKWGLKVVELIRG
jgi:hypothetical protein